MTRIVDEYRNARAELYKLERARNVKIVQACESGSRAWGFASPDSDYDVRFVYVKPIRSYLTPSLGRDVIDREDLPPRTDDLDFSGWDLLKTLAQAARSNPQVLEWLASPIQYYGYRPFVDELRDVASEFNPRSLAHHYSSMAKRVWLEKLRNRGERVVYKKYLYAVRPVLCCVHLESQPLLVPPVDFEQLLGNVEYDPRVRPIVPDVRALLRRKAESEEAEEADRLPRLDDFLEAAIPEARERAARAFDGRSPDMLRIDDLAARTIREFGAV